MAGAARERRHAPPRADVLAAAMAMIAERGLEKLTMAALGREVGMSSGHLLYYFGSKDELLLQTLEWSEGRLGAERGRLLTGPATARERLDAYVDLYVPDGHRDPHWTLWLEVWNRSQTAAADADARDRQAAIEGAWHRDLVALLAEGVSRGEFRPVDPDRFARPAAGAARRLRHPCGDRAARHRPRAGHRACGGVRDGRPARILRQSVTTGLPCVRLPSCSRSPRLLAAGAPVRSDRHVRPGTGGHRVLDPRAYLSLPARGFSFSWPTFSRERSARDHGGTVEPVIPVDRDPKQEP
ncbi:AcrR family transcriptional regulator [Streptomyces phaeoluteigriseus]